MFSSMSIEEKITLLGILLTLLVGLINLFVTIHKNHVDIITKNRISWISDVRKISSEIISWRYMDDTRKLLNPINELEMYLNVSKDIDEKIVTCIVDMYDAAYRLSFFSDLKTISARKFYEHYYENKQRFRVLIRIYLKKEWIRMKVESKLIKIPFTNYWLPIVGFSEKWASDSLMKEYEQIKQYEFKPWITFSEEELNDLVDEFHDNISEVFVDADRNIYFSSELKEKYKL